MAMHESVIQKESLATYWKAGPSTPKILQWSSHSPGDAKPKKKTN